MSNPSCNCLIVVGKQMIWLVACLLAVVPSMRGALEREPVRPVVTLSLDTSFLPIGAPATLTLRASKQPTAAGEFAFPSFPGDTIPGGLEILAFLGGDTLLDNASETDAIAYERRWQVTSWDTGYVAIPPVSVVFGKDTLESNPLLLQIGVPRIEDPNIIAAPADVIAVEWTLAERLRLALPWMLGGLALLVAAVAGFWAWRKYFAGRERGERDIDTAPAAPLEPAHVVALRELERIQQRASWQRGDEKGHHAATSLVVRTYVERRFGLPALERTTVEIRRGLGGLPVRDEERAMLLELLELTDLVKFAKYRAVPEEHERVVTRAIRFVECTLPTSESEENSEQ